MAATASIQITLDEKGAITAINNLKSEIANVGPAFTKVGNDSNVVLTKMAKDHDHARESAKLLREETGIFLPRALQGLIAQSQVLGPILNSAFSVFAIVGFIEVLASIPKKIGEVVESMTHEKAAVAEMKKAHEELRKVWEESATEQQHFQLELNLLGKTGTDKIAEEIANANKVANIEAGRLQNLQLMKRAQQEILDQAKRDYQANSPNTAAAFPNSENAAIRDAKAGLATISADVEKQRAVVDKAKDAATLLDLQYKQTFSDETRKNVEELSKAMSTLYEQSSKTLTIAGRQYGPWEAGDIRNHLHNGFSFTPSSGFQ
jgi:hypothetical protein